MKIFGMCLNWKVVGGLAVVGLAVWAFAPNLVAGATPLLLALACPLSMLFMMRGMGSIQGGQGTQGTQGTQGGECVAQAEQVRRPRHLAQTEAPVRADRQSTGVGAPATDVADLRAELASIQRRQEAIAREIATLEAAEPEAVRAVREAQEVAQAAQRRA